MTTPVSKSSTAHESSGAYLNADLEEGVYMIPPPGILKNNEKGKVCKLLKGLYRLKQAGWAWYKDLYNVFTTCLGFML